MRKVFIGHDAREEVSFHVLASSIWRRARAPVQIVPVMSHQLPMWRERHPLQSTDFSFSRFLVPYLCDYEGWALFMDCDMLMRADVCDLFDMADDQYAVQVVKHDYTPKSERKFLDSIQTAYPKKNWSSVMLFNCDRCRALTPQAVNEQTGLWLHQFKWLTESEVGELPVKWNHLVDEYGHRADVKNVHFTNGGPWFPETEHCDYSDEWQREREMMLSSTPKPINGEK